MDLVLSKIPEDVVNHIISYVPDLDHKCIKLKKIINVFMDHEKSNKFFKKNEMVIYKEYIIHSLITSLTYHVHRHEIQKFNKFSRRVRPYFKEDVKNMRKHLTVNGRIPHYFTLYKHYKDIQALCRDAFSCDVEKVIIYIYELDDYCFTRRSYENLHDIKFDYNIKDIVVWYIWIYQFIYDRTENIKIKDKIMLILNKLKNI